MTAPPPDTTTAPEAAEEPTPPPARRFAASRVWALMTRHLYLLLGSWPRMLELTVWPVAQMVLWGLISTFFAEHSSWVAQAAGVLLGAVLLWDVLTRNELGVAIAFMEEMWSRNLGHIFVSPIRPVEFMAVLVGMGLVRVLFGVVPAALLAIVLYHYSVFEMGLPLIAFFINLAMMGWALGLAVAALLLRWGMGAEGIAWYAVFAIAPLSAVYYPISALPEAVVPLSMALPSAHVFEGMRALLFDGVFRTDLMLYALGLNAVYLSLAVAAFLWAYRAARRHGLILTIGE